jgi:hypothetical protein
LVGTELQDKALLVLEAKEVMEAGRIGNAVYTALEEKAGSAALPNIVEGVVQSLFCSDWANAWVIRPAVNVDSISRLTT